MIIQVLGPGCTKCKTLAANVESAVTKLGISAQVEKVEDIPSIMRFGVVSTPALVVDGRVAFSGRVASPAELEELLKGAV